METQAEKKIEQQKRLREEVDHELEKFRQYCAVQEKEIEVLREELKRHGIAIGKKWWFSKRQEFAFCSLTSLFSCKSLCDAVYRADYIFKIT